MIESKSEIVHQQMRAVAAALEEATIVDRAEKNQARFANFTDGSGWKIFFPANPAGMDSGQRPYFEMRFVNQDRTELCSDFRQPAVNFHEMVSQTFMVTPEEQDPKKMFLQITDHKGSETKFLFDWAIEQYDRMHLQYHQRLERMSASDANAPLRPEEWPVFSNEQKLKA